jgi:predicted DNA-binding protein YlxM (UPF0122 family)
VEIMYQIYYKNSFIPYYVTPSDKIYRIWKNKIKRIATTISNKGYVRFRICVNGKSKNLSLHRIVAETFIPNPENKPEVNHIDGNKLNNTVENLEWNTRKENADHAYRTGLFGKNEDFSKSTITNKKCHKICELIQDTDIPLNEIANITKCNKKIVYDIFCKKTWKEISDEYDFSQRKHLKRIDEAKAKKICKLIISDKSSKEIAEIIGCKIHIVKDIKRGKTWASIMENIKSK